MAPHGGNAEPPHSSHALLTVRCPPLSETTQAATQTSATGGAMTAVDQAEASGLVAPAARAASEFIWRLGGLMTRVPPGWEGVVIDLSEVPLNRALPLLNTLSPSPPPLPPSK